MVVVTDGLPTSRFSGESTQKDRADMVVAMKRLFALGPVHMVIRLCTDEDETIEFYNAIDRDEELPLDILDDIGGEAAEVLGCGRAAIAGLQRCGAAPGTSASPCLFGQYAPLVVGWWWFGTAWPSPAPSSPGTGTYFVNRAIAEGLSPVLETRRTATPSCPPLFPYLPRARATLGSWYPDPGLRPWHVGVNKNGVTTGWLISGMPMGPT